MRKQKKKKIMKKGGLGMMGYELKKYLSDTDFGHMLTQPGISGTLHWFRRGAPPGIEGSTCTA